MQTLDDLGVAIARHARNGILIDANLLAVLVIGAADVRLLKTCKCTRSYGPDDFGKLLTLCRRFDRVLTTAHILTETSNLIGQGTTYVRAAVYASLKARIVDCDELTMPASPVTEDAHWTRLGLTDCVIASAARRPCLVLTADLALYLALCARGLDAINYAHLRL